MKFMANIPSEKIESWYNFKKGSMVSVSNYSLEKHANVIWEGIGSSGSGVIRDVNGDSVLVEYVFNDGVMSSAIRTFWMPKDELQPASFFTRIIFWGSIYTILNLFNRRGNTI